MKADFDVYYTLEKPSEGSFKDRGSRFIAYAFPVFTEDELKNIQKELRKKYFDATHHCYAFRLGADKKTWRAGDDGEPSGSAGMPIYGVIQSHDLSNILIVVVRYFGGTKLGVPGLINAYRSAALEAIEKGKVLKNTENQILSVNFDYLAMNDVMKIIKDENLNMTDQQFDLVCRLNLTVRKRDCSDIAEKLNKISGAVAKIL